MSFTRLGDKGDLGYSPISVSVLDGIRNGMSKIREFRSVLPNMT